jgi:hypothetical protein
VRVIKPVGYIVGVITALMIATAGATSRGPDSGVRGLVLFGPTCPVQRPGKSCTRPYEASITVQREPAGSVVASVRSASDGRFTVRLRVGRYRLEPRNGRPFPRAHSQTISVSAHHFTAVTIRFESGIR